MFVATRVDSRGRLSLQAYIKTYYKTMRTRERASPLGRGTAERACTRAVVGVPTQPLLHLNDLPVATNKKPSSGRKVAP